MMEHLVFTGLVASVPALLAAGAAFGMLKNGVARNERDIRNLEERLERRLKAIEEKIDFLIRGGP